MKNQGKKITKKMVYEKSCLLITSIEADFELSVMQVKCYKKKLELVYLLMEKLMNDKVPPALILAQLNKHFGNQISGKLIESKIIKDARNWITNPINLN